MAKHCVEEQHTPGKTSDAVLVLLNNRDHRKQHFGTGAANTSRHLYPGFNRSRRLTADDHPRSGARAAPEVDTQVTYASAWCRSSG